MSARGSAVARLVDPSQRSAARVAALAYLLSTALVVYGNFGVRDPLLAGGDMAEAVQRIAADGLRFRLSVVLDVAYCVGDVVLVAALYVVLRPVHRHLALLATLWKLMYSVTAMMVALGHLRMAALASNAAYLDAFGADVLQAQVRSLWGANGNQYYVGLVFWSLSVAVQGWLWLKSRYVPAALAVLGMASSVWCVLCTLAFLLSPGFPRIVNDWWWDMPMAVYHLVLSLWLLIRGLPRSAPPDGSPGDG